MRLPGTRYQEPGWEQVRKLLGQCSLQALARCHLERLAEPHDEADSLAEYVDLAAAALRHCARGARAEAAGNSYGDSVCELAMTLLYELQARPADWAAFCAAVAAECRKHGPFWQMPGGEALLRKKVNDMYAVLRDKVDSDNYQVACGRDCSPNRIYAYRMLDTARGDILRLLADWRANREQVAAILGRPVLAEPIEARQSQAGGVCKGEWVLRWSESLERFTGSAGPLHTRSKRFASLKNNPAKIEAMLREIAEYEELSSNRDQDWLHDASQAEDWLDDYWRVLADSEQAATPGPDQILEAREDELIDEPFDHDEPAPEPDQAAMAIAASLSLPPSFIGMARAALHGGTWIAQALADDSVPVRLAVYLKLLGPCDDSYPAEWLDPATGELPTMHQLAALDRVSLPTLRKRRDAAIARLEAARPTRRTN